ncbi:hypothetical protein GIB67_015631, partial [Kingdonia uniflora]
MIMITIIRILLVIDITHTSQEEDPSDRDVSTILEIEQRAHENGLQENYYWPMSFFTNPFEHLYLEGIFMETIGKLHVQQREDKPKETKALSLRSSSNDENMLEFGGTLGIGRNMRITCSCKSSFLAAADDSGDIKLMTSFKAVDELYLLCELESDLDQMKEAVLVLEEARSDFRELRARVEGFENVKRSSSQPSVDEQSVNVKSDHRRPHALSWE